MQQTSPATSTLQGKELTTKNTDRIRVIWQTASAVIVFIAVYLCVDLFILSSFSKVEVEMEASVASKIKAHYSTTAWRTAFTDKQVSSTVGYEPMKRTKLILNLDNHTVKKLRLDPGMLPGVYKIYSTMLTSFFGSPVRIIPYSADTVITAGPETEIIKRADHLEIIAHGNDPYCYFGQTLTVRNPFFQFGTPFVFSILAFIIIGRARPSEWQFWRDVQGKQSSTGSNYQALNGLRGFAALMVILDHSGVPGCKGIAMAGVVIFFSLSGFLLTIPFAREGRKIVDLSFLEKYAVRRLCRIVPMFYAIIVLHYIFNGRLEDAVRSALFLEGDGIYWTVLQEMHFYVLFPLIMLINHFLLRDKKWLIVFFLGIIGFAFNNLYLGMYQVYYMGNTQPLFVGLFICGMMTCYLFHIPIIQKHRVIQAISGNHLIIVTLFIGILLSPFIRTLFAGQTFPASRLLLGNFCYAADALILLLVLSERSIVAKLFCCIPLRILGTISYSFYLIHPIIIRIVKDTSIAYLHFYIGNTASCATALVLTAGLAAITYTLIERPFLVHQKPAVNTARA